MSEKEKSGELRVLFPTKTIDLADGEKLIITPLSLADLPHVVKAFGSLVKIFEENSKSKAQVSNAEIAAAATSQLLEILPYCIDRPAKDVPMTVVPEVLEIILDQNVTDLAVGKWTALAKRAMGLIPDDVSQSLSKKS